MARDPELGYICIDCPCPERPSKDGEPPRAPTPDEYSRAIWMMVDALKKSGVESASAVGYATAAAECIDKLRRERDALREALRVLLDVTHGLDVASIYDARARAREAIARCDATKEPR